MTALVDAVVADYTIDEVLEMYQETLPSVTVDGRDGYCCECGVEYNNIDDRSEIADEILSKIIHKYLEVASKKAE